MLNKNHPKGKHKARVFEAALGFTSERYHLLIQQIKAQALDGEATVKHIDNFGQHLQVDMTIVGVTNQNASIRTGWLVAPNSETASLTTLYVKGESRHD